MILILTNKWDLTADFVIRELRQRGHSYLRLNSEDLISEKAKISLSDLCIQITWRSQTYNLSKIRAVWNRRPGRPLDSLPEGETLSVATRNFVHEQWYSWLEALQILPDVTWINHPINNAVMENKIRQLHLASNMGFKVPATVVTNDWAEALELQRNHGSLIAKALYSPLIEEPEQDFFIFTNRIDAELSRDDEEAIRISPVIFQQPLIPKVDYRVTVLADAVWPVQIIGATTKVTLDWRTQKEGLRFVPCRLPHDVEDFCRNYVRMGRLIFGALDLVYHNDEFYFLEINPNGEWGWLQKQVGLPIAEYLCELLISYDNEDLERRVSY